VDGDRHCDRREWTGRVKSKRPNLADGGHERRVAEIDPHQQEARDPEDDLGSHGPKVTRLPVAADSIPWKRRKGRLPETNELGGFGVACMERREGGPR
jgi:hypothetical protein